MMPGWGVVPDHVARLNMARLRSQGLHLGELRSMAESLVANTPPALPEDRAPAASLDHLKAHRAPTQPPERPGRALGPQQRTAGRAKTEHSAGATTQVSELQQPAAGAGGAAVPPLVSSCRPHPCLTRPRRPRSARPPGAFQGAGRSGARARARERARRLNGPRARVVASAAGLSCRPRRRASPCLCRRRLQACLPADYHPSSACPLIITQICLPVGAHATRKPRQNSCKFWEEGRCERGLNCRFWHDPRVGPPVESRRPPRAEGPRPIRPPAAAQGSAPCSYAPRGGPPPPRRGRSRRPPHHGAPCHQRRRWYAFH